MRLESVTIENFRCFKEATRVNISDLTSLVGRNDIGKSSVLEALEIFFNNVTVKIDADDVCIHGESKTVTITCEFSDIPPSLTLDAGASTSLKDEYLLTEEGRLLIRQKINCGRSKPAVETFVVCNHPSAEGCAELLSLKEKELQRIVKERGLDASLKGNPGMRKAIWDSAGDLELRLTEVPVSKPAEDCKRIWEQLEKHLPIFALFQSDRRSQDTDSEVQDPMKAAVAAAISEAQNEIDKIQEIIEGKTREIAERTLAALEKTAPELAADLTPQFSTPTTSKWTGLFGVNLATEHGIALNKRGSGVRRLIVVSFFRAEAERRLVESDRRSIIYALEEPETAQHPNNQRILLRSLRQLTNSNSCQVVLTTHSPGFAAELPVEGIRFLRRSGMSTKVLEGADVFGEIADELGLMPDSRVRVLICVEGPTDVIALQSLSNAVHQEDKSIVNLQHDPRIAFVVSGGSVLKHWVSQHYLKGLGRPEFHVYDNDVQSYSEAVDQVNARQDGSSGRLTKKHEIESYLHSEAIRDAFGVSVTLTDGLNEEGKATPKVFAEKYSLLQGFDGVMRDSKAKQYLADEAFPRMTAARLRERDPDGEVEGWFREITRLVEQV